MTEKISRTERCYTFTDPSAIAQHVLTQPGMTWLIALRDGLIPGPNISATLEFHGIQIQENAVSFRTYARAWMANPMGILHGGVPMTLLDSAMTCAVFTKLPAGKMATTTSLTTYFTRPAFVDDGEITATGQIVHIGSTFATTEGRVTDARGKLIAHATGTFAIIDSASIATSLGLR